MSLAEIYNALKGMCSICYEHECEITLPVCKDQLCYACMTRYIKEVVHNSWGLNETKMKCPVCLDDMPKKIWMRYADKETVAKYEAYNKPFRSISIFCAFCNSEVPVSSPPPLEENEKQKILGTILQITQKKAEEGCDTYILIKKCLERLPSEKAPSISKVYNEILYGLEVQQQQPNDTDRSPKRRKIQISDETLQFVLSQLISLETDGDCWRELQHKYVQMFPKLKCHGCDHDLCFKCGNEWHSSLSCEEITRRRMSLESVESMATFEWQVRNSKRCPGCSALINREDGCNKMDCLNCGYEFCWVCEEKWSKDCAYFKCGLVNEEVKNESEKRKSDQVHREVGVPDVDRVERSVTNFLTQQIMAVRQISSETGTPHQTDNLNQREQVRHEDEEDEEEEDEEDEQIPDNLVPLDDVASRITVVATATNTTDQNMKKKNNFVKQFVNFFQVKEMKNV